MRYFEDLTMPRRYLELKAQIAELQAELDELKPAMYAAVTDEPDGTYTLDGFQFSTGVRHTYTYSDRVNAMQAELRALKKSEEANGTATLSKATGYVVVKQAEEGVPFPV